MENVYKMFDIWKQILKIQKLQEIENKECYEFILEDLYQKQKSILSYFERNYEELESVVVRIKQNADFDFGESILSNIIIHQSLSNEVLLTFSSLQTVWEFLTFQDFSILNFNEVLYFNDIPYFKEYIEAFLDFKNWEYQISQTYLQMTSKLKEIFSFFVNANAHHEISFFSHSEKSFELEMNVLKKIYKNLLKYDVDKNVHEELLLLFESCLKNFSESCLSDIWNELQAYFLSLDPDLVCEKYFHEANCLLLKYKVGLLEECEIEQDEDICEFHANNLENASLLDAKYTYKDILTYHKVFLELEELGIRILHVYEKIMECNIRNKDEDKKTFYQDILNDICEQEKKIYKTGDLVEIQEYLTGGYAPNVNYFPFMILDILPQKDTIKEKKFALHRMVNYEISNNSSFSSFSLSENGIIQTLDEEEFKSYDVDQIQNLLFFLISFVFHKISKDEFLKELEKIGFDFVEEFELFKEEEMISLWQAVEQNFLNNLFENGEKELVWYSLFLKNKEMESFIKNNFNWMFSKEYVINEFFYPEFRRLLMEELQQVKRESFESDDVRKNVFFSYYLESCLAFFKKSDQEKFRRIREFVQKK